MSTSPATSSGRARGTAPVVAAAAPPRQRRKQARPQELLDAALELFVERGFAATRSEDVAARAGVSKGTLYLYYPSKEELLKEVIRHNVVNLIAEGADIVRQFDGSSAELLAKMLRAWWERVGDAPASGIIKLMTSEARNFPEVARFYVDEVIAPSNRMLAGIIERGIARGEFRAGLNVPEVVHAIVGPLVFMVLNKHSLGACSVAFALDPKAVIEALIDLARHGLEARGPQTADASSATAPVPATTATMTKKPAAATRRGSSR
jgi:AcrR family transcriptional regulator